MTIEKDFFRQVMGQFSTGVSVVTTRSDEGLAGLTVNSFTSVSLDPPLVLFCADLRSIVLPFFRASGTFAVNVLTSEQEALDRKSTRLNSSHTVISYAVFCLRSEEHTSELQSHSDLVCRLLLE